MIRLRQETLPPGLSALVRHHPEGDLDIVVSSVLSAGRQRAAVKAGLRAIRSAHRPSGLLPVPALIMLALAGGRLRGIARVMRLRPAATLAIAATATAAAVVIVAVPHQHSPPVAGPNSAGGVLTPSPGAARPTLSHGSAPTSSLLPSPAAAHSATTTATPSASPSSLVESATPPAQGPSAPAPSPGPTGNTSNDGGLCLHILNLRICL